MRTRIFTFADFFEAKKTELAEKLDDIEEEIDDVEDELEGDDDDDDNDEVDKPKKKTTKVPKGEGVKSLLKIFKERPLVKMSSLEDEQGAYTLAGLKKALKDKYTPTQVDQFMYELQNDKENKANLKSIKIKEYKNGQSYPYFYMGEFDADAYKAKLEKASKEKNAESLSKKQELVKKQQQQRDEVEKKKEAAKEKRKTTKKELVEGEEVKPKGKRGRPKKNDAIKESVMKFKEFTFGVKEGLNDEIIGTDYGVDDEPYTLDGDVDFYNKVEQILEDDYDYLEDDFIFSDFEDSEYFFDPEDEYEYAAQYISYIESLDEMPHGQD